MHTDTDTDPLFLGIFATGLSYADRTREQVRLGSAIAPKRLTCACCGASTLGRQWHNQDIGFGFCAACDKYLVAKGYDEAELHRLYGVRGYHRGQVQA